MDKALNSVKSGDKEDSGMVRSNAATLVGVLLLVAVLAGVAWSTFGALPGCRGREGAEAGPLKVGTNVWPGYEPLYLARSLKYFDVSEVKLVEYSSATQVLRNFRNRTIHVAALTLDEVLQLRDGGVDTHVILAMDISDGGDVIMAAPEVKGLEDLKGKRIGVENTALGAYVLSRALEQAHIDPDDITVVPITVDKHETALADKRVDAVVTFDPIKSRLLVKGMVEVFDSSMIPGEIVDVLVVRPETLESRFTQLTLLLESWFKALRYLEAEPDDAALRMAPRMQLEPADVLASYDGLLLPDFEKNLEMLAGESPTLNATAARLAKVMADMNLLDEDTWIIDFACPDVLESLDIGPSSGDPRSRHDPSLEEE